MSLAEPIAWEAMPIRESSPAWRARQALANAIAEIAISGSTYRLDFALTNSGGHVYIAVEVDGQQHRGSAVKSSNASKEETNE